MRLRLMAARLCHWPLHPFFLSAFFVLSYWLSMENRVLPLLMFKALTASQVFALLLARAPCAIQRHRDNSPLSATVIIYWCMCFVPFYNFLILLPVNWTAWPTLAVYLGVLGALFFVLFRLEAHPKFPGKSSELTMCMNVMT